MSNVNIKYLKDESGKKFSPVVSAKSLYSEEGTSFDDMLNAGILYRTQIYSGGTSTNFSLTQPAQNFTLIEINYYAYYDYRKTSMCIVPSPTQSLNVILERVAISKQAQTWLGTTSLLVFKTDGSVTMTSDGFNCWNHSYNDGDGIEIRSVFGWKKIS